MKSMLMIKTTEERVSSCCFVAMEEVDGELVCTFCDEECQAVLKPCKLGICDGSGEIEAIDTDGHLTGYMQKCPEYL